MKKFSLPLLIALVFILNCLIYLRAVMTIEDANLIFGECARNSGRTAAAINLTILLMVGHIGLKSIYRKESNKDLFRNLISLFAINHLIHFYFVTQNFRSYELELNISGQLQGFITFIFLLITPVILWTIPKLNKTLYFYILLHLFNVTYFIAKSFYGRYKPVDPAYLHRLGILVMISAVIFILYREYKDQSIKILSESEL